MEKTITEPQVLANVLDNTRQMTNFYLQKTSDIDKNKRFQIEQFNTCSISWIVAHLAWAEDFLILRGVGNHGANIEWFKHFEIGKEYPENDSIPPYEEIVETFNIIHSSSIKLLRSLPAEAMNEPNNINLSFGDDNSKRALTNHCIRHEGNHCGHIGWLIRMHGQKVI